MTLPKRKILLTIAAVGVLIPVGQYLNIIPSFQFANSEENTKKPNKSNVPYLTCSTLSDRMKDFLN